MPSARVNSQSIQIKAVKPPPKFETYCTCNVMTYRSVTVSRLLRKYDVEKNL